MTVDTNKVSNLSFYEGIYTNKRQRSDSEESELPPPKHSKTIPLLDSKTESKLKKSSVLETLLGDSCNHDLTFVCSDGNVSTFSSLFKNEPFFFNATRTIMKDCKERIDLKQFSKDCVLLFIRRKLGLGGETAIQPRHLIELYRLGDYTLDEDLKNYCLDQLEKVCKGNRYYLANCLAVELHPDLSFIMDRLASKINEGFELTSAFPLHPSNLEILFKHPYLDLETRCSLLIQLFPQNQIKEKVSDLLSDLTMPHQWLLAENFFKKKDTAIHELFCKKINSLVSNIWKSRKQDDVFFYSPAMAEELLKFRGNLSFSPSEELILTIKTNLDVPKSLIYKVKNASRSGDRDSVIALAGAILECKIRTKKDVFLKLHQLAEQRDSVAQHYMGLMYFYGNGVEKSHVEAMRWYRLSAKQGNAEAQYHMGLTYYYGTGVRENYAEAVKWYLLSAEQGNDVAQLFMGCMYHKGLGVEKNYVEAVKWFRLSAKQGNAVGQLSLGGMYHNGQGVEKSYVEAVKWFRLSAKQGNAVGQLLLGGMYHLGQGMEQSDVKAMKWIRLSAEQGNADAQFIMGCMYHDGQGVELSYVEAVKWYRLSAEQGVSDAQINLGGMYENGQGVEQSYVEARKWYRLAEKQGNTDAQNNLGVIHYYE